MPTPPPGLPPNRRYHHPPNLPSPPPPLYSPPFPLLSTIPFLCYTSTLSLPNCPTVEDHLSDKPLIHLSGIPDSLLADLDTRDIALCIRDFPTGPSDRDPLLAFLGLPWRLVLSEASDPSILRALQSDNPSSAAMTRKRGFVQVIDQDPSRIQLPQRCLPFYVLPTDRTESPTAPFDHQLRRLTMLEELRRSAPRQLLFLSVSASPVPPWLADLFSAGFRAHLTFVADRADSDPTVLHWLQATPHAVAANLVTNPLTAFIADVLARYSEVYPEHRHVVRVRNQRGIPQRVDITDADEPERADSTVLHLS